MITTLHSLSVISVPGIPQFAANRAQNLNQHGKRTGEGIRIRIALRQ